MFHGAMFLSRGHLKICHLPQQMPRVTRRIQNTYTYLHSFFTGLRHPFGITIFKSEIYWTDWMTRAISRAGLDGESQQILKSELPGIMDVCVFDRSRQIGDVYIVQYHSACRISNCITYLRFPTVFKTCW